MIATCPEVVHEGIERFLGEISKANPSNLKARSGQAADQGGGSGVGFGGGGGGFGGGSGGMGGGMF